MLSGIPSNGKKQSILSLGGSLCCTQRAMLVSGITFIRPFLVFSQTFFDLFTLHLNIGYEFHVDRSDQNVIYLL